MYVNNQLTLLAEATIEIAADGPFEAPKIALYTNNVYPARGMVLADFTITNFAGLTNQKSVTWGVPFLNDNGQAEVDGGLTNWLTVTLPDPAVTAYGYVLLNTAGDEWLLAERFAEPIVFTRIGQSEGLVPRLIFDT